MDFAGLTGRGVRVAIIDSGVNPDHPHVGGVAGGIAITSQGESDVFLDYLGHGTAVTAAIHEKAPEAELYAVKVFDRALRTNIDRLLRAVQWSIDHGAHVVNLSLGTSNPDHQSRLQPLIESAAAAGMVLVAARSAFPGGPPGIIAVEVDWECPRSVYRYAGGCFHASGYPRPIPGVAPTNNLNGISFAVANMTGFVARLAQICAGAHLEQRLIANALRRVEGEHK